MGSMSSMNMPNYVRMQVVWKCCHLRHETNEKANMQGETLSILMYNYVTQFTIQRT